MSGTRAHETIRKIVVLLQKVRNMESKKSAPILKISKNPAENKNNLSVELISRFV